MRSRAIAISFTIAALGAVVLFFYFRRMEDELSGGQKIAVLVIAKAVEAGAPLRDENLGERLIPQAYVEPRNVRAVDRARIVGLRMLAPLQAQESLLWSDVALANDSSLPLSSVVQPGMRAYTIQAERKSASLVNPGDRIDVIGAFSGQGADQKQSIVLLQNVLVIGRGTNVQTVSAGSSTDSADLAISVTLRQAQMLALAAKNAELSVALRATPDTTPVDSPDVIRPKDLIDLPPPPAARAAAKHQPTVIP